MDSILKKNSPFIISEIGINHNGDKKQAVKLIKQSKKSGADSVKFQIRNLSRIYNKKINYKDNNLEASHQYIFNQLKKSHLNNNDYKYLFKISKKLGLKVIITPFDENSARLGKLSTVDAIKIGSPDAESLFLINKIIEIKKPLIISTGMSSYNNISKLNSILKKRKKNYALLHCCSSYPPSNKEIGLSYIKKLKKISKYVGYSGHERDINVSVAAVALGAKIIERHITLDINMEGSDHKVSLLPIEFKNMVTGIRQVEKALNYSKNKNLNQGEIMNREILGKSIFVSAPIKEGEVFSYENLCVSAPGKGLQPNKFPDVIGKTAQKDFCVGDNIFQSDISETSYQYKDWKFNLKHGLPVRYHDFEKLYQKRNFEIVEFHLSYKDLELNPHDYLSGEYEQDLIVHCPELFANDHILDLASEDKNYLNVSLKNLDKTIHETLRIAKFFPKTKLPLLIVNVGGFTSDKFLDDRQNEAAYDRVANILKKFRDTGVEIIPQTMPPFPWHFGGQRYHNLFVKNDEIVRFCKNNGVRVCFDISHSKLACNYYNIDFFDFIKDMSAITAHLHIVDAKGISGEGLQIGEGEIRFKETFPIIENNFINKSFVPEIWQGHKNNGQGFWQAFDQLS